MSDDIQEALRAAEAHHRPDDILRYLGLVRHDETMLNPHEMIMTDTLCRSVALISVDRSGCTRFAKCS